MADGTILGWLLIGLVAGILAKFVAPPRDGGIVVPILIGIAGALLGGFVGEMIGHAAAGGWTGVIAPAIGAAVSLLLARAVLARRG